MSKIEITEKNKQYWIEWFELSKQPDYNQQTMERCLKNVGFTDEEIEGESQIVYDYVEDAMFDLLKNNVITPKWKKS
jgi:hypothetical protein